MRNGIVKSKTKQTRRVISSQSIGVRPYVDDLREMNRLCDNGTKETVTELARTLINEALRARRIREVSSGEDALAVIKIEPQAVAAALDPLREEVRAALVGWQQQETQTGQVMQALYTLLVQVLGYSMMTERETRRLLEGELTARGQSPESIKEVFAQLEERSHQETDEIVFKVLREHRLAE